MKLLTKVLMLLLLIGITSESQAQMFWNQAVSFPGSSNSYLRLRPTSATNITGSFTLEAWVYPTFNSSNMVIISKGSACSYGLKLSSRRPTVVTNNIPRLISKTSSVLPLNQWSHVAGVFNSVLNKYDIYINGALDTSTFVSNPPAANSDSLYIGKQGLSTYWGMMDDIRIWNKSLSATQIKANYRTFIGLYSPEWNYSGLVLSLPFNEAYSSSNPFTLLDFTNNSNPTFNSNVTAVSLTDQLYTTISPNQSLEFDGTGDYAAMSSYAANEITGAFTTEAWVYLREYSANTQRIFRKGDLSNGYGMFISSNGTMVGTVNSNGIGSNTPIPLKTWTHIAFTQSATGLCKLYINGEMHINFNFPNANPTTDSIFVGGLPTGDGFNGYIDELRISKIEKTQKQIQDYMYTSIDRENDFPGTESVYNMDGGLLPSADISVSMYVRGNAKFSSPNTVDRTPISPLVRYDSGNYQKGFRMKTSNKRIPETGTQGTIYDSIYVNPSMTITDVNVFLGINHTYDGDIEATLFAPNGDSAKIVFDRYTTTQQTGDIIGIFDDQADSSLVNGRYTYFSHIKPEENFNSIFSGDNAQGNWVLKINDDASGDTGMLYSWGIQLNNATLVGVEEQGSNTIPDKFHLAQNYPNPFNPTTAIRFSIAKNVNVKLKVYDITGREVASLLNEEMMPGVYEYTFNGSNLSSGAYFYRLEAGDFIETKKMMLVK